MPPPPSSAVHGQNGCRLASHRKHAIPFRTKTVLQPVLGNSRRKGTHRTIKKIKIKTSRYPSNTNLDNGGEEPNMGVQKVLTPATRSSDRNFKDSDHSLSTMQGGKQKNSRSIGSSLLIIFCPTMPLVSKLRLSGSETREMSLSFRFDYPVKNSHRLFSLTNLLHLKQR